MNSQDEKMIDETLDEAQINADDRTELDLPEAPASMTLRVWIKGYGVMLTARDNKVASLLKKTETMIDYAESHGWKNTWDTTPAKTATNPVNPQTPVCGIHGTPMEWKTGTSKKTGKPYAFWSCATRNADGSFCSYKPDQK